MYPDLKIVGHSHGYLRGDALRAKVDEINALAPDYLWVALGVPYEQAFVEEFTPRLSNVGVIKTSGGLFNFLSGSRARAPQWMQNVGLEWAWRIWLEPRRLFWRYLTTNPRALYLLFNKSRSSDHRPGTPGDERPPGHPCHRRRGLYRLALLPRAGGGGLSAGRLRQFLDRPPQLRRRARW